MVEPWQVLASEGRAVCALASQQLHDDDSEEHHDEEPDQACERHARAHPPHHPAHPRLRWSPERRQAMCSRSPAHGIAVSYVRTQRSGASTNRWRHT